MNSNLIFEILGYLAPVALVISFFFKNMKILRWVNTVGCLLFVAYGVGVGAWPVVVANVIISITNLYYLFFAKEVKFVGKQATTEAQKEYMRQAISLASQNVSEGKGGPFGAVVVKNNEVIAAATNRVAIDNDPTSHAEINAIRQACQQLGTFDLSGCEIYTSCEPGPLSLSAIYWARIGKVYYAASRGAAAAIGFDDSPIYDELGRQLNQRKLPMAAMLQEEGEAPLKLWKEAEKKVKY